MTGKEGQRKWLGEIIGSWIEPVNTRKMQAAELYHEHFLHTDKTGTPLERVRIIYGEVLDRETIESIKSEHASLPPHNFEERKS